MGKELIGRVLMVIGTIASFQIGWWAPLVAAPLIFKVYILMFCFKDRIDDRGQQLVMDLIAHASYAGYLIMCIVIFSQNTGKWYLGMIPWFVVAQLLGLLWPRRWYYEKMEGRL